MGQKYAVCESGVQFSEDSFSAPVFFASVPLNAPTNYAHGWRGNTTDTLPM
jgi:hypothetical protein